MRIRVLIIDDSPTMRAILMAQLAHEPDIAVVGTAANAAEGRELIKRFNPDVITLDIEMPGMNGLGLLDKIMRLRPMPVIVVSGSTQQGSAMTARALALGAVDCYAKADRSDGQGHADAGKLAALIRDAAQVRFTNRLPAARPAAARAPAQLTTHARLIAIGSSTGGVEALQVLLRAFPENCPPTIIVQHIDARFAPAVAKMLDTVCPARVVLADPGQRAKPGHVYLAPGDNRHMTIGGSTELSIGLRKGAQVSGHVPSVDVLFQSVVKTVGGDAIGILLSGMGSDGAQGLLAMAQAGAHTIAQDEASCAVFGMPRMAIALGAAGVVAPIDCIARHVFQAAA